MKLGLIVQRYGTEVLGGSEHLCRLVAERLAATHDVEVLTTCAQDYITWKNDYPEGTDRVRGVTVRRFANARTRDIEAFNKYSDWIYNNPHTRDDEMEWLKQQGPWTPGLIDYLRKHQQQYDVVVFFTYLYAPTVAGLEVVPARSVLVPTAHDEPAIRLEIFTDVFRKPAALCYLTESERDFVHQQFSERPLLEDVIGVGVEIPPSQPYPRMPAIVEEESATEGDRAAEASGLRSPDEEASDGQARRSATGATAARADDGPRGDGPRPESGAFPSHLLARGAVFRRRHRMYGPMVLYGGRIDPGKGCEELIQYFSEYVKEGGDATLALMGVKLMSLPEEPFIRFAGLLSDRERLQALEAATVVVCPSPYESLSLLALESLAVGTPILVNARSAVLVEHCVRSNGGLYYADRDEFVECLKLLVGDERLRAALGRNGREYVRRSYRWDVVLGKYERIFAKIRNAR
ncbi:MAG TPA: glycosyltransferase [Vicinamibacterales bacterium]|jgi:glycosyltransferase involved in cell wall biosynthesis|nr:glycosyltransferase [Vicinamibacterales bacterium]